MSEALVQLNMMDHIKGQVLAHAQTHRYAWDGKDKVDAVVKTVNLLLNATNQDFQKAEEIFRHALASGVGTDFESKVLQEFRQRIFEITRKTAGKTTTFQVRR